MARMDEIRQSITNETTKEWMAIRFTTFHLAMMTTIISVQSPPYLTISRRNNSACPLPGCGIMASRKQSHTATTRSSSAVGWYIARKRIAETRTPNEMHMKSTCNANASFIYANASLFDANAFQMQCKCNTNAFVIFHIIANASKSNANASVFYANALLLQDIKEIYIISLYIPFHYIYRERGNKFPSPQIGINFKEFAFFSRIICMVRGFVVLLRRTSYCKAVENRKQ